MTRTFYFIRFRRDDSGQTVVLAALMLPILIGMVGLAVDVGYAFDYKKQMQHAADSAAIAGAYAVKAGSLISDGDLTTVARMDATGNGFTNGASGITVAVCRPGVSVSCPTTYTYTSTSEAVKVSISQPKSTFLTKILGTTSITVGASAVAASVTTSGGGTGDANIIVLDTECDNAFTASGGSNMTLQGSIYVNACGDAAAKVGGGGSIVAPGGIFIGCSGTGDCGGYDESGGSTFSPTPTTGYPQIADPLAGLPEPTPTGTAYADPNITEGTVTLYPGIYPDITVTGGTAIFSPGIYFINGGKLNFKGTAQVFGDGVMFYAYNDALLLVSTSDVNVTMSAPTSGTYRGIWYFQQRSNVRDAVVSGGANVNISGVIYISNPSSKLSFTGGSTSGQTASYTVFVVWEFVIGGGGYFNSDYSSIGGSPLSTSTSSITLAE